MIRAWIITMPRKFHEPEEEEEEDAIQVSNCSHGSSCVILEGNYMNYVYLVLN